MKKINQRIELWQKYPVCHARLVLNYKIVKFVYVDRFYMHCQCCNTKYRFSHPRFKMLQKESMYDMYIISEAD